MVFKANMKNIETAFKIKQDRLKTTLNFPLRTHSKGFI